MRGCVLSFSGRFFPASAGIDKKAKFSGGKRTGRSFFRALLLGVFLAFLWWVLSAFLHAHVFGYADSVLGEFFSSDLHVLFTRGFVALLIILSVILTRSLFMRKDSLHDLRMARELREKQMLRSLVEDAPLPAMLHAEDGEVIMVNRAWRDITGYSLEDIPTTDEWVRKAYGERAPKVQKQITATYGFSDRTEEGDFEIRTRDGERRILKFASSPVGCGEDSDRRLVLSVADDITERKERENEWRELLERMINAFVIFDSVFDENGKFVSYRFVYINKAYEDITGVSLDEVRGKTVHEVWPGTEDSWVEAYGKVATTGRASAFEMYHGPTEKLYYCQVYRPYPTRERFCVVFEDITKRKRTEKQLEKREEELGGILQAVPAGVGVVKNRIISWGNEVLSRITGYSRVELTGLDVRVLYQTREEYERVGKEFYSMLDKAGEAELELELRRKDGSDMQVLLRGAEVRGAYPEGDIVFAMLDITETRTYREMLRLTRYAVDKAGLEIFWIDPEGHFVYTNEKARTVLGYGEGEMGGLCIWDVDPRFPRTRRKEIWESLKRSGSLRFESIHRRSGGEEYPVEVNSYHIEFGGRELEVAFAQDITERKRATDALMEAKTRYKTLFDNMSNAVAVYEAVDEGDDFIFRDFNDAGLRIEKVAKEDVVGRRVTDVFPGVEEFGLLGVMRSVYRQGTPRSFPTHFYKDDRIAGWRKTYVYKLPTGEIVCVYEDVSERKRAEKERNDLFELSTDMFCIAGFDGLFKQLNPAWERTLGWKREELMKTGWAELIHPDDTGITREAFELLKQGKKLTGFESRFRHADGSYRWLSWNSYPVPEDEVILAVARDVTDKKESDKELEIYRERLEDLVSLRTRKLEEANRELESFSYSVSHDLRAPLRAINGFSEMLQEDFHDKLGKEGQRMLNVIKRNTRSMSALIDSLLRYSRLGRKAMSIETIDVKRLAEEVFGEQLPVAGERKVRAVAGAMPEARGDRVMIRQVLSNLISNALKYTDREAEARIETGGYKENGNNIYYVKDNGVGFDMKYAGKLFELFQRLHSEKEYGGTGVGLGLVQRAVQKHGGKVWAESEQGKGAVFYFSIPAEGPAPGDFPDAMEEPAVRRGPGRNRNARKRNGDATTGRRHGK
jgi:PAS domain S-box-containing protein